MSNTFKIKAIKELKDTKNSVIFMEMKTYIANNLGKTLVVKDETGCIRTISFSKDQIWKEDKFFKDNFVLIEEETDFFETLVI